MAKNPFHISIVIPTYNRAGLLRQCVESILLIERYRVEIIIVDDASIDGSLDYLASNLGVPPRHQMICLQNRENYGAQLCRNRGLERATAPIIQFVDSDDVVFAKGVEEALDAFPPSREFDYVYGKVEKCDYLLRPLNNSVTGAEFQDVPEDIAGYHWHTMGALYSVEFLRQAVGSWNEELSGSQDWEYQARVKIASSRRKFVPATLGLWRQHDADRVSVRAYNSKYVGSVSLAVQSIAAKAINAGVADRALMLRLWKRLLLHAAEAGAHADKPQKQALLRAASDMPFQRNWRQILIESAIRHAPTPLNAWIFQSAPMLHKLAKNTDPKPASRLLV